MAAPKLVHYTVNGSTTGLLTLVPAVPAGRSLVIAKILVQNYHASASTIFGLNVGGIGIGSNMTLAPGQVYTQGGLVVLAGETVQLVAGTANTSSRPLASSARSGCSVTATRVSGSAAPMRSDASPDAKMKRVAFDDASRRGSVSMIASLLTPQSAALYRCP